MNSARYPAVQPAAATHPNSRAALQGLAKTGRLSLLAVFTVLLVRPAAGFVLQVLTGVIFLLLEAPDPWTSAAQWWPVYAAVVDVLSLLLVAAFLQSEQAGLVDLIAYRPDRFIFDLLTGAGLFFVFLLLYFLGDFFAARVIFDGDTPSALGGLPLLPALYTTFIWPILWAFAGQIVYNGYGLPRLEALFGSTAAAWLVTAGLWTLQYLAIPLGPDLNDLLWRLVVYAPITLLLSGVYLLARRLVPLIFAHWLSAAFLAFVLGLLPLFD